MVARRAAGVGLLQANRLDASVLRLQSAAPHRGAASARVFVIDEMNPLPFVLGAPAPRGANLSAANGAAIMDWPSPEQALRDADYVAIPRFLILRGAVVLGLETYREYLSERFTPPHRTPYWDVLERRKLGDRIRILHSAAGTDGLRGRRIRTVGPSPDWSRARGPNNRASTPHVGTAAFPLRPA